jgi:hypothetical protein
LISWFVFVFSELSGLTNLHWLGDGFRRDVLGLSLGDPKDKAQVPLEVISRLVQLVWIETGVQVTEIYFAFFLRHGLIVPNNAALVRNHMGSKINSVRPDLAPVPICLHHILKNKSFLSITTKAEPLAAYMKTKWKPRNEKHANLDMPSMQLFYYD